MQGERQFWGLVQRRECRVLTWRGRAAALLTGVAILIGAVRAAYPFLAISDPVPGGILIVEGWAPGYVLAEAQQQIDTRRYAKVYVTGGPLERGVPLAEFKTYAALGAASLFTLGLNPAAVETVPAAGVQRDRTYASALALKQWLQDHRVPLNQINVITMGPHARRTRLLFTKAFGPGTTVGIVSVPSEDYEPAHWWRSSAGVRNVVGEVIGYAYARVAFNPQTD